MALTNPGSFHVTTLPTRPVPLCCQLISSCTHHSCLGAFRQVTPRGVQLHLGMGAQPRVVDTMVMSNLGYFQLKASPGVWALSLAPGGGPTHPSLSTLIHRFPPFSVFLPAPSAGLSAGSSACLCTQG